MLENNITLDQFTKLPDYMLRAFLRDLKYESTIPIIQRFEEEFIKPNEKIRERYYKWKIQMRYKMKWKNEKQSFAVFEKYVFKYLRALPKLNEKMIFHLILANKRLHKDLQASLDDFYCSRKQKLHSYLKQLNFITLKNLYDIEKIKLQYYIKVKKYRQLSEDTVIPFPINLKKIYEDKKYINYKDLDLVDRTIFFKSHDSLKDFIYDHWDDFKSSYYEKKISKTMTDEQAQAASTPMNVVGSAWIAIKNTDFQKGAIRGVWLKIGLQIYLKIKYLIAILLKT